MAEKTNKIKVRLIRTLITICSRLRKRPVAAVTSGRFLVVSTTGIGDTLWGTPAISALRKKYPEGYIGVLTNPAGAEILKDNPAISEIFTFRRGMGGFFRLPLLVESLIKKRLDKVFIFHASDRIIWPICFLTGSSEITGFKGQSKDMDFILTNTVEADPAVHCIENRFRMLAAVGVVQEDESLELFLDREEDEEARHFLKANNIGDGELIVGLHPGAQKPFKCWPAKNFIEAGNMLHDKLGCRIVITGDAGERQIAGQVASGIDGAISSAGSLSLRGTAALIKRMSLFITNDTGPMHIAFALKTPVIALFSPTDPALCGPYRADKAVVIAKKATCVPCVGKKCYNPKCFELITPQEVIAAAEGLLKQTIN